MIARTGGANGLGSMGPAGEERGPITSQDSTALPQRASWKALFHHQWQGFEQLHKSKANMSCPDIQRRQVGKEQQRSCISTLSIHKCGNIAKQEEKSAFPVISIRTVYSKNLTEVGHFFPLRPVSFTGPSICCGATQWQRKHRIYTAGFPGGSGVH